MISVVIPVYNVELYLEKCLLSVINQTYKDIEIVVINDGSTDNSGDIAEKFARDYPNVTVYKQENRGLSMARNVGIERSHGEWVYFLDSDDWIEPNMLETLLELAIQNNADIASCKTQIWEFGKGPIANNDSGEILSFSSHEMIDGLITQNFVRYEVWNKIWKREIIGDTRFVEGQVSEDIHFDRIIFLKANKMVHIEKSLHNYLLQRPGSTFSVFREGRMCVFDEYDRLIEDAKKLKWEDTAFAFNNVALDFAMGMYEETMTSNVSKDIRKKIVNQFKKYYSSVKKDTLTKNGRLKSFLFNFSPFLFGMVWSTRKKLIYEVNRGHYVG